MSTYSASTEYGGVLLGYFCLMAEFFILTKLAKY